MPRKLQIDSAKLVKAIESGKPSKEIMEEFGIKTSAQLKAAYLDALIAKGKVTEIASNRGSKGRTAKEGNLVKVSKRGSVAISSSLIEEFGFKEGDVFTLRKTKSGIAFKKAE